MADIKITWTNDSSDCETCGFSICEGAEVEIDGKPFGDFTPNAGCTSLVSYERQEVLVAILTHLHSVKVEDKQ